MIRLTQKNGKKVMVNPVYISHMVELREDKTDIFFIATNTMINMKITVLESIDEITSKIANIQD